MAKRQNTKSKDTPHNKSKAANKLLKNLGAQKIIMEWLKLLQDEQLDIIREIITED